MSRAKVRSAITTDFILYAEIVIIAMGTVMEKGLTLQILTLSVVALLATVGVYGVVVLIVRMDDAGYALIKSSPGKGFLATLGNLLINALPVVIRVLSVGGTIALVLVAGGIFAQNVGFLYDLKPNIPSFVYEFMIGLLAGLIVLGLFTLIKMLLSYFR